MQLTPCVNYLKLLILLRCIKRCTQVQIQIKLYLSTIIDRAVNVTSAYKLVPRPGSHQT